jgi:hypothetical protein
MSDNFRLSDARFPLDLRAARFKFRFRFMIDNSKTDMYISSNSRVRCSNDGRCSCSPSEVAADCVSRRGSSYQRGFGAISYAQRCRKDH